MMTPTRRDAGSGGRRERRQPLPTRGALGPASFRASGIDTPELDARLLIGHALGARSRRGLRQRIGGRSARDEDKRDRGAGAAPPRPRAGRAHCRHQGILEPAAARRRRDAGAAARDRNGRRSGARRDRRCGGPRSRALRIADLGTGSGAILLALLTELPNAFGVGTDVSLRGACGRARQCAAIRVWPRRLRGLRHGRGVARAFRSDRFQSALYRSGDIAALRARGALVRPAPRARRRTPTGLIAIARLPPRRRIAGAWRLLGRRIRDRPGRTGRRLIRRRGACAVAAATRSYGVPRALVGEKAVRG